MMLIDWLTDPHIWASFITLSAMEVVLGIDNVVFISLMVSRMHPEQRLTARRVGLLLALIFRIIMLGGIAYIIHLTTPLFSFAGYDFSWRDLILIAGGLFLLVKGTREMHDDIEGQEEEGGAARVADTMARRRAGRRLSPIRWSPPFCRSPSSISSSPSIRSSPRSAWPSMSK